MQTLTGNDQISPIDPQHFDPAAYPLVVTEIKSLRQKFLSLPVDHKAEMLISYLRDHSIKAKWVTANPEVAKLAVSNRSSTSNIEMLLASCRQKPEFFRGFEEYFRNEFRSV